MMSSEKEAARSLGPIDSHRPRAFTSAEKRVPLEEYVVCFAVKLAWSPEATAAVAARRAHAGATRRQAE